MKEYIIYFGGTWMRFFINRFGLCVSKMENNRNLGFEILLPDAKCDFCASCGGELIHLVCQSSDGNIIYLTYDGRFWEKTVLLKGKEAKPYDKYFNLLPIGKFMNLFYVITHDGKAMLIHQILDGSSLPPEVVDYVNPVGISFFAAPHISSDISLYYQNLNGQCGTKIYRWSHKSFLQFIPILKDTYSLPPFCRILPDGEQMAAPAKKEDGTYHLMFYFKNDSGEIQNTQLCENCEEGANPVIFVYNNKIYVQWQDKGSIMSSSSSDGLTFTKPVKYLKNASLTGTLYRIDNGEEVVYCYGYRTDSSVSFYSAPDILNQLKPQKNGKAKIVPNGQEAFDFAARAGFKKSSGWEDDPYVTQKELKEEIQRLMLAIDGYNKILDELGKKIKLTESADKRENPSA